YCHEEEGRYDFEFFISDEQCRIVAATDTTVTIVVPDALSSGPSYMVIENQIFYGPYFTVLGSVSVDDGFVYISGKTLDGVVYQCMPWCKNTPLTSEFYLCGDFYLDGATVSGAGRWGGVSMINNETGFVGRYISGKFYTYRGIPLATRFVNDGTELVLIPNEVRGMEYVKSEVAAGSPGVLIYGSFDKYQSASGTFYYTNNNMALLKNDFSMPTASQTYYDSRGAKHSYALSTFAGGTDEMILRGFTTAAGKIVAVGNFYHHKLSDYANSVCNTDGTFIVEEALTPATSVTRMELTGALDYSYRRDPSDPGQSLAGASGTIRDACMTDDESIIIVGEISAFDGLPVANIVKLDANGQVDEAFLERVGSGAEGIIRKITHASYRDAGGVQQERVLIVGNFTAFNGTPVKGLVMMDADGNVDERFVLKEMEGGFPNFAKIVDLNANGNEVMPHVVISGTFNKYAGVIRRGFLILDMNGDAIQRFNVPGAFSGELYDASYSLTSGNANGLLIVGNIYYFDGNPVNNIVMLQVDIEDNFTTNE
ncbi:MAG: DUF5124 domain-containing protein, partial [Odoribacteraceae bacterium]|nr:DUF5124 domain-containing protein [Odoribacteraceae bacterium]